MITKLDLRETLEIPVVETGSVIEQFQNQSLRPVLKLQNELYLKLFSTYCARQNPDFNSLSAAKKRTFIEQSLQKDSVLKNIFIGITIGMLTLSELESYTLESKEYNKRIITMLTERIKDQTK